MKTIPFVSFLIKFILACVFIVPWFSNGEIISLDSEFGVDTITYDTDTGLRWLDVTVTQGLSYSDVVAQMGVDGTYEGWRYATVEEFDQLIVNFGYIAQNPCPFYSGVTLHCDTSNNIGGQGELIEGIILTLGDIFPNSSDIDKLNGFQVLGAGYTRGILGTQYRLQGRYDVASIFDKELIRISPIQIMDFSDSLRSIADFAEAGIAFDTQGSFLVAEGNYSVPTVQEWYISALLALMFGITVFKINKREAEKI